MTAPSAISAAIIGSGNIGTDLMIKLLHGAGPLRVTAMAGIDPASDGLARAARLGVATTAGGVRGLVALPGFGEVRVVFDATSATAHAASAAVLTPHDVRIVDLTPAALGPFGGQEDLIADIALDIALDLTAERAARPLGSR